MQKSRYVWYNQWYITKLLKPIYKYCICGLLGSFLSQDLIRLVAPLLRLLRGFTELVSSNIKTLNSLTLQQFLVYKILWPLFTSLATRMYSKPPMNSNLSQSSAFCNRQTGCIRVVPGTGKSPTAKYYHALRRIVK